MKRTGFIVFLSFSILFLNGTADAQKRPVKRPAPKPTPAVIAPLDVRAAKQKVSNQISNVTRFTDLLGPAAAGIESIDKEAKTKTLKPAAIQKNEDNKRKLVEALKGLRTGLVSLETEFRTKPNLRKYLIKIEGITALSAQSENSAFAGRFTESRTPLLTVLQKLSDTYAAMPGTIATASPRP